MLCYIGKHSLNDVRKTISVLCSSFCLPLPSLLPPSLFPHSGQNLNRKWVDDHEWMLVVQSFTARYTSLWKISSVKQEATGYFSSRYDKSPFLQCCSTPGLERVLGGGESSGVTWQCSGSSVKPPADGWRCGSGACPVPQRCPAALWRAGLRASWTWQSTPRNRTSRSSSPGPTPPCGAWSADAASLSCCPPPGLAPRCCCLPCREHVRTIYLFF